MLANTPHTAAHPTSWGGHSEWWGVSRECKCTNLFSDLLILVDSSGDGTAGNSGGHGDMLLLVQPASEINKNRLSCQRLRVWFTSKLLGYGSDCQNVFHED